MKNDIADKKEVVICCSRACLPFFFAIHPWFVLKEGDVISRWEIVFRSNKNKGWGYLHCNLYAPFSGIEIFSFSKKPKWKGRVLAKFDGPLAEKMIEVIKKSQECYPHLNKYRLGGPNSNTYAQWVIDHFPEANIRLPKNAFGKNFLAKIRKKEGKIIKKEEK
jgi:hypothetical protein